MPLVKWQRQACLELGHHGTGDPPATASFFWQVGRWLMAALARGAVALAHVGGLVGAAAEGRSGGGGGGGGGGGTACKGLQQQRVRKVHAVLQQQRRRGAAVAGRDACLHCSVSKAVP